MKPSKQQAAKIHSKFTPHPRQHYTHHFTLIPPVASSTPISPTHTTQADTGAHSQQTHTTKITVSESHSNLSHKELKAQLYNEYLHHYCVHIGVSPTTANIANVKHYLPQSAIQYLYDTHTVSLTTQTHTDVITQQQAVLNKLTYRQHLRANVINKQFAVFDELRQHTHGLEHHDTAPTQSSASRTGVRASPGQPKQRPVVAMPDTDIDELTDAQIEHIDYIQYIFTYSRINANTLRDKHRCTKPAKVVHRPILIKEADTLTQLQQPISVQLLDVRQFQSLFNHTVNSALTDKSRPLYGVIQQSGVTDNKAILNTAQQLCVSDNACAFICLLCHHLYHTMFSHCISTPHMSVADVAELEVQLRQSVVEIQKYIATRKQYVITLLPYLLDSICTCVHYVLYKQYDGLCQYETNMQLTDAITHHIDTTVNRLFEYDRLLDLSNGTVQQAANSTSALLKQALSHTVSVDARRLLNKENLLPTNDSVTASELLSEHRHQLLQIAMHQYDIT